jgi:hypothetical protein
METISRNTHANVAQNTTKYGKVGALTLITDLKGKNDILVLLGGKKYF